MRTTDLISVMILGMPDAPSDERPSLYFHSPCFDGIVSCLLSSQFLEQEHGWPNLERQRLVPVNYDLRDQWLGDRLGQAAAVVDFHYHPDALFWADHHVTTFLTPEARRDFERRQSAEARRNSEVLLFDPKADSCSVILWDRFGESFRKLRPQYEELVEWSRKIDSAQYDSVEEAIFGTAPALFINSSLAMTRPGYPERLVRWLRGHSLDEVASLPEVREMTERARDLSRQSLQRFRPPADAAKSLFCSGSDGDKDKDRDTVILSHDGIVLLRANSQDILVDRYAPYYFFPNARYSISVVRHGDKTAITAMRNPWLEFPSVPLGEIFETVGGGGHERVGASIVSPTDLKVVEERVQKILEQIRVREQARQKAFAEPRSGDQLYPSSR